MPLNEMLDENKVKQIIEEEFQRLVRENPNGINASIEDRLQALESKLEEIQQKLGI
jgi:hypothetical protein